MVRALQQMGEDTVAEKIELKYIVGPASKFHTVMDKAFAASFILCILVVVYPGCNLTRAE